MSYPYHSTKRGVGVDGTLPLSFFFSKRFWLQWKAFDLLNKLRLILSVVTLLEACDVTKHGRHFERHLGFYQELEIRYKPREMIIFLCLTYVK